MECSERWGMLESGTSRKGVLRKTRPGRPRESDLCEWTGIVDERRELMCWCWVVPPMDDGQGGIQMMYGLEEMRHEGAYTLTRERLEN